MTQRNKLYELIVSFTERQQAVVTIEATTEEEAINKLRLDLEGQVGDLNVDNIRELADLADGVSVSDLSPNQTIN